MMISMTLRRGLLLGGALCALGVAVVVSAWVIPPVLADRSPLATPERAATAFRVVTVGGNTILGSILCLAALIVRRVEHVARALAAIVGPVVLIIGLLMLDAATSFAGHEAPMQTVSFLLFICAGCELAGGVLALAAAAVRARAPSPPTASASP